MLAHIVEAGVAANHCASLMLRLVHDLAVVRPVELRHRDERGAQRVRRVTRAQVLLGNYVDILRRHPASSHLVVFAQGDEYAAFRPVKHAQPRLQGANGAERRVGRVEDGFLLSLAELVGLALVERYDQAFLVEGQVLDVERFELRSAKGSRKTEQQQRPVAQAGRRRDVDAADGALEAS